MPSTASRRTSWCGRSSSASLPGTSYADVQSAAPGAASPPPPISCSPTTGASRRSPSPCSTEAQPVQVQRLATESWGVAAAGLSSDTPNVNLYFYAPPVVFRNHLHWGPDWPHYDVGLLVFGTVAESFRSMRCLAGATGRSAHLCEMEGLICFSCLDYLRSVVTIWVLEDYEREVWSFKYHVKFPAEILFCSSIAYTRHCVLSHEGDVLVYNICDCRMFHCDCDGKLLEEFQWEYNSQRLKIVGHKFKESLIEHELFSRGDATCVEQPSFFKRL
uniref:F-box associated domain-containing protein n=1 Tax=Aegilops tauschii TaxID=37682 RepID=M8BCM8_AEGTA